MDEKKREAMAGALSAATIAIKALDILKTQLLATGMGEEFQATFNMQAKLSDIESELEGLLHREFVKPIRLDANVAHMLIAIQENPQSKASPDIEFMMFDEGLVKHTTVGKRLTVLGEVSLEAWYEDTSL